MAKLYAEPFIIIIINQSINQSKIFKVTQISRSTAASTKEIWSTVQENGLVMR